MLLCANDMSVARLLLATLAGGFVSSMTDWFFHADWLYKRYDRHPEIWRKWSKGETTAILWASPLPFLTCASFAFACAWLNLHSLRATLTLAATLWLMAPLPLAAANALFMKLTPAITLSHVMGWLVKLAVAGAAVSLIAG
jgi:hypothetical protein